MKMKEVCTQTGLTERAVRFYVMEQLVSPLAQQRGGRTWLDFSQEDISRLQTIATLRTAGFTLEEIKGMFSDFSTQAPKAAFALRQRLRDAADHYEKLCRSDPDHAGSPEELAARLRENKADAALVPQDGSTLRRSRFAWEDWLEWGCMLVAAILGWRIYIVLVRPLDELLFFSPFASLDVILLPMIYLAVALPISLLLGSKAGKWLGQHLDI